MWDLIVSVPDHCLSFYFSSCDRQGLPGSSDLRLDTVKVHQGSLL